MNASDAKKLRVLEGENNRLKRILAEAMLDNVALKDIATKNYQRFGMRPPWVRGPCRTRKA